ncbi:MAG: lysostaphin resistance A-like protein [Thermoplasmatota archaeon]
MIGDNKWGGVPPAGERRIDDRGKFILGLLLVILIEWAVWLVYRYLLYTYIVQDTFSDIGFIFHIFAAPIIGLSPILIYWRFIRKEKGLPWRFTGKNLYSSVMVGAVAAALLMVFYQFGSWLVLVLTGYGDPSTTSLISLWRSSQWEWFVLMTFTFFVIVGPVEELQYRSFLQDQFGRVLPPYAGLFLASVLFALSHIPIYLIVYRLDPLETVLTLCWTFTMGSVLGFFYFQSRNIWGPIIMHGFWDWVLSVWALDISLTDSYSGLGYLQQVIWLAPLLFSAVLAMIIINVFYVALWKRARPEGSFGIGPVPVINNAIVKAGERLKMIWIAKSLSHADRDAVPLRVRTRRSLLGVAAVCIVVMLLTAPGATFDRSAISSSDGDGGNEEGAQEFIISFDDGIYVQEGSDVSISLPVNETAQIVGISVSVIWTEPSEPRPWMVDDPDTFKVEFLVAGELIEDPVSDTGSISFTWSSSNMSYLPSDLELAVECLEAGDVHPRYVDLTGLRRERDDGNDVTVSVRLTYMEPSEQ